VTTATVTRHACPGFQPQPRLFTAGQTTSAPEIVSRVRQMSDMLRCEALPRGASLELMMRVAKEQWTT